MAILRLLRRDGLCRPPQTTLRPVSDTLGNGAHILFRAPRSQPEMLTVRVAESQLTVRPGTAATALKGPMTRPPSLKGAASDQTAIRENSQITRYATDATVCLTPGRCMEALDKGWRAAVAVDCIMQERLI